MCYQTLQYKCFHSLACLENISITYNARGVG
jgi:hypothetical protein